MSRFLEIAKPLIDEGFSVIPIEPRDKRPIKGIGVTQRINSSQGYWFDRLDGWADAWPDANVAICADENIVVLETDDYNALTDLLIAGTGNSFPQTRAACGSSANRPHFFFKRTEKATNVGNLIVPGIFEARFSNQYVVAPGSIHPDGSVYRWLNDLQVVEIPDWLVSELARLALSQKSSAMQPTRRIEMQQGRVLEGSRHYFLMSELGRIWNGKLTEEEMIEKARELNALCDPPKDEAHVLQCVRDIMRRKPNDPGPKVLLGGVTPSGVKQKEGNSEFRYPRVAGKIQDYVLRPKEGQNPFSGWFPRGRVSLVGGSSGVGKTTLIVDLLNKQRAGERYLGHPGAGLDFLVLFADRTTLSNVETLTRMGLDRAQIPIAYMPVCWDGNAVNQILANIEDHPKMPAAVFVEGADALVSDANKTQVVAPFLAGIQKIAEHYHIAMILSVGAPKQKPKEGYKLTRDQIFGSQMWGRMAEDVVVMAFAEEEGRILTVAHRNAKSEKFTLEFNEGLLKERAPMALDGVAETKSQVKSGKFLELVAFIESLEVGTIVPTADELKYYGSKNTVGAYLAELSNPMNAWIRKEGNRWVVADKNKTTKGE